MATHYFLKMIQALRQHEEIVLYQNVLNIQETEAAEVMAFLEFEYKQESLSYPQLIPPFDPIAALWAAITVYLAAQLILYRKHEEVDLENIFSPFSNKIIPSAMLSADLCLRFLPNMIIQLKIIDSTDKLIDILENILLKWHFSGINYPLKIEKMDFEDIKDDSCLMQLYANRVIEHKKISLSEHNLMQDTVKASLGIYADDFWKDYKTTIHINDND